MEHFLAKIPKRNVQLFNNALVINCLIRYLTPRFMEHFANINSPEWNINKNLPLERSSR